MATQDLGHLLRPRLVRMIVPVILTLDPMLDSMIPLADGLE